MHALLAHATHLATYPLHFALLPIWRPLLVALAAGFAMRLVSGNMPLAAAVAVFAGWVVQSYPWLGVFPPPSLGRLPGLALIVLADSMLRQRSKAGWWLLPSMAALCAWWLRGTPLNGPGIVNCMPVFLGFLAAFPLGRRLARGDSGFFTIGAALALAGGLLVTGAPPYWARASLVPAVAALVLLNRQDATPTLAGLIVAAAGATMVANDRGRLVPIDAACLAPMLVWILSPRLAPRVARSGPALAGLAAAALCVGVAWATGWVLEQH